MESNSNFRRNWQSSKKRSDYKSVFTPFIIQVDPKIHPNFIVKINDFEYGTYVHLSKKFGEMTRQFTFDRLELLAFAELIDIIKKEMKNCDECIAKTYGHEKLLLQASKKRLREEKSKEHKARIKVIPISGEAAKYTERVENALKRNRETMLELQEDAEHILSDNDEDEKQNEVSANKQRKLSVSTP